jgi:hypothetical protein
MLRRIFIGLVLACAFAPAASASGGRYVFDGGTRAEQAQVTAALNASSFDWNVVPGPVVIHIGRNVSPVAVAGQIWLDTGLLDAGRFSWGVVQHEYAHQVDFGVLTDAMRAKLGVLLGGSSWWGAVTNHSQLACERFADLVAWSYWPSPDNIMRPESVSDEGGQVSPAVFRATLESLLHLQTTRAVAAVSSAHVHRKG